MEGRPERLRGEKAADRMNQGGRDGKKLEMEKREGLEPKNRSQDTLNTP